MKKSATISPCGLYRYDLVREIEPDDAPSFVLAGTVAFVLNNPSKADGLSDDPTSTRGIGYTIAWGYSKMIFANTNPYRATNPRRAVVPPESVLLENDRHLRQLAINSEIIVAAWGDKVNPVLGERARRVLTEGGRELYMLELSKRGIPRHPLMLKKSLRPLRWLRCDGR